MTIVTRPISMANTIILNHNSTVSDEPTEVNPFGDDFRRSQSNAKSIRNTQKTTTSNLDGEVRCPFILSPTKSKTFRKINHIKRGRKNKLHKQRLRIEKINNKHN